MDVEKLKMIKKLCEELISAKADIDAFNSCCDLDEILLDCKIDSYALGLSYHVADVINKAMLGKLAGINEIVKRELKKKYDKALDELEVLSGELKEML